MTTIVRDLLRASHEKLSSFKKSGNLRKRLLISRLVQGMRKQPEKCYDQNLLKLVEFSNKYEYLRKPQTFVPVVASHSSWFQPPSPYPRKKLQTRWDSSGMSPAEIQAAFPMDVAAEEAVDNLLRDADDDVNNRYEDISAEDDEEVDESTLSAEKVDNKEADGDSEDPRTTGSTKNLMTSYCEAVYGEASATEVNYSWQMDLDDNLTQNRLSVGPCLKQGGVNSVQQNCAGPSSAREEVGDDIHQNCLNHLYHLYNSKKEKWAFGDPNKESLGLNGEPLSEAEAKWDAFVAARTHDWNRHSADKK